MRGFTLEDLGESAGLALAYTLAGGDPPRSVSAFAMADALCRAGLQWHEPLPLLAARLAQIASRTDGFELQDTHVRGVSPLAIAVLLAPLRPPREERRAGRPASQRARARASREPTARRAGSQSSAPAPRARATPERPARTKPGAPPPQAAPSPQPRTPVLPAAAAPAAIEVAWTPASVDAWLGRMGSPEGSVSAVSLALRGRLLANASSFQDLLGVASLRGVESLPYQLETVRRVLRVLRGRALLADEVGLGKTIEAIMVLREYQLRGMVRRALILAPPSLTRHWRGELGSKAGLDVRSSDDASFRADPAAFWRGDGVVVASIALARSARHAPAVQAEAWDLVVVDEAHHLKNRNTLAHRLVNGLDSRFLLLLTATPVETDLEEIYNLVTLLAPGQLTTPAEFRRQFVDPKDPTRPRDAERLRRLLGEVMVRNTRAQSGLALPPRYVETIAVEPHAEEREAYDDIVTLLREHARGPARLVAGTLLLEAGSSPAALRATLDKIAGESAHSD